MYLSVYVVYIMQVKDGVVRTETGRPSVNPRETNTNRQQTEILGRYHFSADTMVSANI